MGSPMSSTIAEIFLQYLEETYMKHLLDTKNNLLDENSAIYAQVVRGSKAVV